MIEINANPHRLDLDAVHARRARRRGVKIVINPDAHATGGLDDLDYGIGVARRAWLGPSDVVNTADAAGRRPPAGRPVRWPIVSNRDDRRRRPCGSAAVSYNGRGGPSIDAPPAGRARPDADEVARSAAGRRDPRSTPRGRGFAVRAADRPAPADPSPPRPRREPPPWHHRSRRPRAAATTPSRRRTGPCRWSGRSSPTSSASGRSSASSSSGWRRSSTAGPPATSAGRTPRPLPRGARPPPRRARRRAADLPRLPRRAREAGRRAQGRPQRPLRLPEPPRRPRGLPLLEARRAEGRPLARAALRLLRPPADRGDRRPGRPLSAG